MPVLAENEHIRVLHLSPFFYLISMPGTLNQIHYNTEIPTGPTISYPLVP